MVSLPQSIVKNADVLRTRLRNGFISIKELDQFLSSIAESVPLSGAKKPRRNRFAEQMDNLARGRALKPIEAYKVKNKKTKPHPKGKGLEGI